jgi:hypothetical protein
MRRRLRVSDKPPPIGENPFQREMEANTANLSIKGYTATISVSRNLDSEWFAKQCAAAEHGIGRTGLPGSMEVRFALETSTDKSPKELLDAVQRSEIKTFGWPIGITLQSRDEWRPRPTEDGIKAEVAISQSERTGRSSYDYWALTGAGDFYLLQSLFEDTRGEKLLFFNTRIVRVTEALLFGANLYARLGASPDTKLKVRFGHKGLAGRELSTSSINRVLPHNKRVSIAAYSNKEFVVEVGRIREDIVRLVSLVCSPMFELFDFTEFGPPIYEDIVSKFVNGIVT